LKWREFITCLVFTEVYAICYNGERVLADRYRFYTLGTHDIKQVNIM